MVHIVAQAVEPYTALLQYGAAGIMGAVLIWRYERSLAAAEARAQRAEDQRDALTERVLTDTLPLLGEINRKMIPTAEKLAEEVRRMGDKVSDMERGRPR